MDADFWDRLDSKTKGTYNRKRLADELGISVSAISMWKYRKNYPTADVAVKLAEALDTTVEYLVTGKSSDTWQPPRRYADIVKLLEELNDSELEAVKVLAEGYASRKRNKSQKAT